MGTHSRPSYKILNEFKERVIECPNCRLKIIYDIVAMRRIERKTWPLFQCVNISCRYPIIEYREQIPTNNKEVLNSMLSLLYHNYSSTLDDVRVLDREKSDSSTGV